MGNVVQSLPRGRRLAPRRVSVLATLVLLAALGPAAPALAATTTSAPGSVEINQWNSFYATEIEATFRFVGAFVVIGVGLYIFSGLTSGFLVGTTAVEWNRRPLRSAQLLGPVLMLAAAALLPIYAMFQPFVVHDIVRTWAWAVLVGIFAVLFLLFAMARSRTSRECPRMDFAKAWWQFLVALLVLAVAGISLWFTALTDPRARFVMSYVILAILSVITTAVSYGQSRRLTVEAKSGAGKSTHDEASTEYLLARLQTLGLEHQRTLHYPARQRKLGALATADLSSTPAGQIAAIVARFAVRRSPFALIWRGAPPSPSWTTTG